MHVIQTQEPKRYSQHERSIAELNNEILAAKVPITTSSDRGGQHEE